MGAPPWGVPVANSIPRRIDTHEEWCTDETRDKQASRIRSEYEEYRQYTENYLAHPQRIALDHYRKLVTDTLVGVDRCVQSAPPEQRLRTEQRFLDEHVRLTESELKIH